MSVAKCIIFFGNQFGRAVGKETLFESMKCNALDALVTEGCTGNVFLQTTDFAAEQGS